MSPPGGDTAQPGPGSRKLETGKAQRKRGRRGESLNRRTVREINATAETRLAARLDVEPHPNVEYSTTARLEDLFDKRRSETAGTFRDPFFGQTTAPPKLKAVA